MTRGRRGRKEAELQLDRVNAWNRGWPVGTRVIVTEDDGRETHTTTRSEAWLAGGHTAVVQLADRSGCYLLQRVRAAGPLDLAAAPTAAEQQR